MTAELLVNFNARNHILGTDKVSVAKFCMQIVYTNCWPRYDKLPPNGRGLGHVSCDLF